MGRKRVHDALLAGRVSSLIAFGFAAATALIFWLATEPLVGFFLKRENPANAAAIALAVEFIRIAAVFQLVDAGQAAGAGSLRGLKDTTIPAILAFLGYWVLGFSAGAYLAFGYGLEGAGVWMGLAVGLTAVCVALVLRFELLMRKMIRQHPSAA